jgi:hypothetical protein
MAGYKTSDGMKLQVVLSWLIKQVLKRCKRWLGVKSISGGHFLKGDDTASTVGSIQEADGVAEHAIAIWQGKIYNLNQEYASCLGTITCCI